MNETKIEPAVTAEEWRVSSARVNSAHAVSSLERLFSSEEYFDPTDLPAVIAFANAALPDSDPRKITREKIALLRSPHTNECSMWDLSDYPGAQTCNCGGDERLSALADALESYLPPA